MKYVRKGREAVSAAFECVHVCAVVAALSFVASMVSSTAAAEDDKTRWSETLERISSGVVAIRVDATRAFDTGWNLSSQATGFVVDAKRGLILTNRHVVTAGPVTAEAIFINNEEVELEPVYRDPVHDFGLFKYDPSELHFIEPSEIKLDPKGAQIGREIRVVGNDAGEQLAILAGTIARLDRRAPDYGRGKYNDFNTFYIQAASSTSGGSSGSPVIDINGNAVALNAGANSNAASSFFLPLDRIETALRTIQKGQQVQRGTFQTVFVKQPFDELERLGLTRQTEAMVRKEFPDNTGMLVISQVARESNAVGIFEPGDILIRANGHLVSNFVSLAATLDQNVGADILVEVQRGGQRFEHSLTVGDLHAISPREYLEFGDAVVNNLSYLQALQFNRTISGVYVANPGYVFGTAAIPRNTVITALGGHEVTNIDDFESVLNDLADGERTSVRFFTFDNPQASKLRVIRMDRRWYPARRCYRNDDPGYWPCRDLDEGPKFRPPAVGSTRFATNGDPRSKELAPSLVMVNFDIPYTVSGVSDRYYHGTGLIVDAKLGLIAVDRNTVPIALGDVRLTFAGSLEIPGRVAYVHPLHNLALVAYDTSLIGDTPVKTANLSSKVVKPGEEIWVVGLKGNHQITVQAAEIASVEPVHFPLSRTLRFRDSNLETISLVNGPTDFDGVIVDKRGRVLSLWSSFAYQAGRDLQQTNTGIPADLVMEMLDIKRAGKQLRSLETEFSMIPLASARKLGINDEWVSRLESHDPKRRQVLSVVRAVAASPAAQVLRPGDLILAVDGKPVTRFRDVELAVQKDSVSLSVWRDGYEIDLPVETVALHGHGVDRVVAWSGALLQTPHRAMAAQRGIEPYGVYVAYFAYGSPANRFGLWAGRRIVEADGMPTPDLDSFLVAVDGKKHRESVRLKTITWNSLVEVITLKVDNNYWPTYELLRGDEGWRRENLMQAPVVAMPESGSEH